MEKKCYYSLSDGKAVIGLILDAKGLYDYLEGDFETFSNAEIESYTLTPIFMTQHEFDNLPEYEF
jgi:hypothetical protein